MDGYEFESLILVLRELPRIRSLTLIRPSSTQEQSSPVVSLWHSSASPSATPA